MGAMLVAAGRRSAMPIVLLNLVGVLFIALQDSSLHAERTFFGTLRVTEVDGGTGRALINGTTEHGRQRPGPTRACRAYYARSGPLGDVFALRGATAKEVGVVGLGVGTVAAYGRPGQRFTFFEARPEGHLDCDESRLLHLRSRFTGGRAPHSWRQPSQGG